MFVSQKSSVIISFLPYITLNVMYGKKRKKVEEKSMCLRGQKANNLGSGSKPGLQIVVI